MSRGCPDDWILGLHQALLILLILGKWVLPRGGGVTRDELSQLLLIFVGTAADILEFMVNTRPEDIGENGDSVLMRRSTDIWVIMESLLIQDGPFLIVRIMVIIHYRIFHQMLFFFAFKNLLVVILNVYRLIVICRGDRDSSY
ncbi:hypothetical protein JZ751_018529 [Albula glossodonta]|uniref:Uncharacterized protein n=1 Tax=Albula glossodonta TaxID=121402 RepID=A0A8T2NZK5_9TELE|nr:hypothetical protein JZ751_018529 [Albula glossodonta]